MINMEKYGKTWWGKKWLHALKGIDHSNRLPRGKTYANTGRVYDIQINGNVITGKVEGNYSPYYKVTVMPKSFDTHEQQIISEVVNNSPSILSSLINKELPTELYDELLKMGIELFPKSWSSINADCNCPDYALPCKHIAGLIYMIALEIDKDPFTAFLIHDCNLLDMIPHFNKDKSKNSRKIPTIDELFNENQLRNFKKGQKIDTPEIVNEGKDTVSFKLENGYENQEILEEINFSEIPDLSNHIFSMLKSNPIFYEKDFKKIMERVYGSLGRSLKKYIENSHSYISNREYESVQDENTSEWEEKQFNINWNHPSSWENFEIIMDKNYDISKILISEDNVFNKNGNNLNTNLTQLLIEIPQNSLNKYNYKIQFLFILNQFAIKLIEKSSIIPEILKTGDDLTIIRWIPPSFDKNINDIYEKLSFACPKDLIKYENKEIHSKQQIKTAISIILSSIISTITTTYFPMYLKKEMENPVFKLFFTGKHLKFDELKTKGYEYLIDQWLSNLHLRKRDYELYLTINEEGNNFTVDLESTLDYDEPPKPVYEIISDKKNYKKIDKKLELLSDIYLLQNYLPELGESIDDEKPITFNLNDFSHFFLDIIPLLEIMGIFIILPKSLEKLFKPKLNLSLIKKNVDKNEKAYLSFKELITFQWELALGDYTVTKAEFKKLLNKSERLVKLSNGYLILDKNEINNILKRLDKLPNKLNQNELMQAMLSGQIDEVEVNIDGELSKLVEEITQFTDIKVPDNLNGKLRHYQERGFSWLIQNINSGFGSILADDMGLGKTLQILTAVLHLKNNNFIEKKKVLVVAPTSLLYNWEREIKKFTPSLKSLIYHGQDRKFSKNGYDILITSYGMIRRDIKKFNKEKWFLLVVDEAQNIKNPGTQQTKSIKSIKADHKIALSGTPVENRLLDYWSIFDFVNKHYLSTINKFKKKFIIPIEKDRNTNILKTFKKITAPFILRRLKTDKDIIDDLPDKIENDLYCSLTPNQTALYKKMVESIMEDIDESEGIDRKGLIFKLINALKQICNHPSQFTKKKTASIDESGKMQVLINILENINENSEKVLIFTQFVEMGNIMKKLIEEKLDTEVMFLHGGLSRKARDKMVNDFQNNTQKRIFIVSLKAGGTGLNLTAAKNVIHYDLWWNPAVENQATDRAYRIGQKDNVMVYRFITKGTFEERINDMIKGKKELADVTVGSGEKFITEIDKEELRELLDLR
jgi:SNF2 family DNA or RNA helicase/uncharacterized Zn finger protein